MRATTRLGVAGLGTAALVAAMAPCPCADRAIAALWPAVSVEALAATPASQAPERKTFEAATIRENKQPGMGGGRQERLPGGRFVATKQPLRALLRVAYGNATIFRPQDQMEGVPGWVDSVKYDIEAKAAEEFKPDPDGIVREHLVMLRTLLGDTFKIEARVETRQKPIYELVRLRDDGFGPQFKPSTTDCSEGAPPPADGYKCGFTGLGPGKGIVFRGMPINALLAWLRISPAVDRLTYDKTGLSGNFDFEFHFAPPFVLGPGGAAPNPDVDAGPTVFTALREQLGFKLEPATGPVDILVIERIERLVEKE